MSANKLDKLLQAVLATYDGFLNHQEFKEIALGGLALAQESGYSKILVDTSRIKIIKKESQQWINDEWFPKAVKAGVKYMAFLVPNDFFGKMSVETTNKQMAQQGDIIIQYFTEVNSARKWLRSKT